MLREHVTRLVTNPPPWNGCTDHLASIEYSPLRRDRDSSVSWQPRARRPGVDRNWIEYVNATTKENESHGSPKDQSDDAAHR